jgi:hypothetical protein
MMVLHFSRNKPPLNFSAIMIRKLVPVKKERKKNINITKLFFFKENKIKYKIIIIKLSVLNALPGNSAKNLLDQKGYKSKCRFSQVIILDKYEVDPQGMIRYKRIIFIMMQKRKK